MKICKNCGHEIGWAKLTINPLIQFWKHKEETNYNDNCKFKDCDCTNPEPEVIEVIQ